MGAIYKTVAGFSITVFVNTALFYNTTDHTLVNKEHEARFQTSVNRSLLAVSVAQSVSAFGC